MRKTYLVSKGYTVLIFIIFLFPFLGKGQNVGINTDGSSPDGTAMLDVKSTNKGLLVPRMTTAQRTAITAPAEGLLVFDTDSKSFWFYSAAKWNNMSDGWMLNGNNGTNPSTHFIGTVDDKPLVFKVNNVYAGSIDPIYFNVSLGQLALNSHTLGSNNTAVGRAAMQSNTTGSNNTATGYYALTSNINARSNTANGAFALYSNISGEFNTAIGRSALLFNTTGGANNAMGYESLSGNTSGNYNTSIGNEALIGNTTGSGITAIGAGANVSSVNLQNATAIGLNAVVNASNKVRIGNGAVTVIEGQVPFTSPSDGRFKYNVQEDVKGLDFILRLRPVSYNFDVKKFDAQYFSKDDKMNDFMQASYNKASAIRRTGFIAQEVEKAAMQSGYDFSGIIKPETDKDHYSLSYESFVVPMVKAIQEQEGEISELKAKAKVQENEMDDLKAMIMELKKTIIELKKSQ